MKEISFRKGLYLVAMAVAVALTSCGGSDDGSEPDEPGDEPEELKTTLARVEVIDYSPAPGQFVNEVPEYEAGDTKLTMNAKAEQCLNAGDMISLGAWGGSVTLKLLQPIENKSGEADFRVLGNAVYATASTASLRYGSAEPGIVFVMQDANGNGIADDEWYELKGDETFNGVADYVVTYYRPTDDEANDTHYIKWEAGNGDSGYINRNSSFHTQDFFPMWLSDADALTFSGRRLPDNGVYNEETQKYDLMSYTGYADSHPNTATESFLDIADAVDVNGKSANLLSIDFIKIYTGVLQANGPLGECSTEVAGIEILLK